MLIFNLKRSLKLGFRSLRRHLLRSILTMLGIVFGVGSVVAMLAVGEGASYESQERIKSLGSQNIILKSVKPPDEDGARRREITSAVYGLTYADAARVQGSVPGVEVLLPIRETRQDIWNRTLKIDGLVRGTMPWYLEVTGQTLERGRFLAHVDMHRRAPVCVIGSDIRKQIFPHEDPLGKTVRVGRDFFRVVGVLRETGAGVEDTGLVTAQNVAVLIPFTTARERYGKTILKITAGSFEAESVELHMIMVRVRKMADVLPVSEAIQGLLTKYHPRMDYEIIVPLKLLEEIKRNARMFSMVLGMIAAISLLVGGIGIMNIMLANVTERTREIGIRRALGAKKRDIIVQFLSETLVLAVVGGLLGLGLGLALPILITVLTGMKVIFAKGSLVLAFSISALVGLISGIYPAYRAAAMNPIDALRHT